MTWSWWRRKGAGDEKPTASDRPEASNADTRAIPRERTSRDRLAVERYAKERAQRDRYAAIQARAPGLLRRLLALHAPLWDRGVWVCMGCDTSGFDSDPPEWPCRSAELALESDRG